ncbi:MAG: PAS domain S-box protein [Candidatus Tectomicrobia bacterium]|nr:PAS domain S-box protein [Candidatus Tectomicrobia bacterium]
MAGSAAKGIDLPAILQRIVQESLRILKADRGALFLRHPENDTLQIGASIGLSQNYRDAVSRNWRELPIGRLMREPEVFSWRDVGADAQFKRIETEIALEGFRSAAAVALFMQGVFLGWLSLYFNESRELSDREKSALQGFADLAAVAIEETRHVRLLKARLLEQESLVGALGHIPSGLDVDQVIQAVLRESARVMGTDRCSIMLPDARTGEPRLFMSRGISPEFVGRIASLPEPFPLGRAYLADPKRDAPTLCPDVGAEPMSGEIHLREGHRSLAAFPLRVAEKNIGVLLYFWTTPQTFGDQQLRLGQAFADQVAISIANARLFAEARRRATSLQVLDEIAKAMASTLDLDELFKITVEQVMKAVPCVRSSLYNLDVKEGTLYRRCIVDDDKEREKSIDPQVGLEGSPYRDLVDTREPRCDPDIRKLSHPAFQKLAAGGLRSVLKVPILGGGQCVGFLNVASTETDAFTEDHIHLVRSVADHLALAMRNANLFAQARETGERLDNFVRGASDGIITVDLDTRITSWNPGAEALYGYVEGEVLGRKITDVFWSADLKKGIWERIRAGQSVPPWETVERRRDGTPVEVSVTVSAIRDDRGRVVGFSGINRDIGAQKRAEEALRKSEEKYRTLFERASDAIEIVDEEGRLIDCNRHTCELMGYAREELLGMRLKDIVAPEYNETLPLRAARLLEGKNLAPYESANLTKDGSRVDVEVSAGFIEVEGRKRIIFFLRDITERKRLERHVRQSQKLEALGQLASGVAHDFNNILAVILGRTELSKGFVTDPEIRRDLDIIEKAALSGARTVKRLQDFARRREDRPAGRVNLNEVVCDAAEMTRPRWKDEAEMRGLAFEVKVDARAKNAWVRGEASELHEALINLINNSLEAMPQGGRITLSTEDAGDWVTVCVADTGKGMTLEAQERAFEPFFTTKKERGSGLGLSMVYSIVERHRGKISLESAPEKGASVRLTFPVEAEGGERGPDRDPSSPRRILIIDDEEEIVKLFHEVLELEGHAVETATDPHDGLAQFRKRPFDLVFTDLGMPGMPGWEVAKSVKEIEPRTPVILVTGWGVEFDEKELAESGVDYVLGKPFKVADILGAVARVIEQSEGGSRTG